MISDEGKKLCREIGIMAERIVCLTDYYEDAPEKPERSLFYDPRYVEKENIISDLQEEERQIARTIREISVGDLNELYQEHGISLVDYADGVDNATFGERYENNAVRNYARAIVTIVIDLIYLSLADDQKYRVIAEGKTDTVWKGV